ncbi:hypothetical protein Salat_2885300 [Sesamum alatum]|uniref:Uncharacterized protein n=1 Tax=Sesamum alatum TaxID=300844 RepID=A0AAE2C7Y6_9LAMI|nr:hypothetical protein Salat_2885300 [Sesamum alatum]
MSSAAEGEDYDGGESTLELKQGRDLGFVGKVDKNAIQVDGNARRVKGIRLVYVPAGGSSECGREVKEKRTAKVRRFCGEKQQWGSGGRVSGEQSNNAWHGWKDRLEANRMVGCVAGDAPKNVSGDRTAAAGG